MPAKGGAGAWGRQLPFVGIIFKASPFQAKVLVNTFYQAILLDLSSGMMTMSDGVLS